MKTKQAGFSIIEAVTAILLFSIIFLGYVKTEANTTSRLHSEQIQKEMLTNIVGWNEAIFNRTNNNESISKNDLFQLVNNFNNEDCFQNSSSVIEEEFKMFFCHIIRNKVDAQSSLEKCEQDNLCFSIILRPDNNTNQQNCGNYNNCVEFKLKGLEVQGNQITRKEFIK